MRPNDYSLFLNGTLWSQLSLAATFVVLRVYSRQKIIRNLGLDDLVVTLSLVNVPFHLQANCLTH